MSTDLLSLPVLPADHRIPYGSEPSQFGDLWLPRVEGQVRVPVVVFFHGGWWKSEYDLGYAGRLCAALKSAGIACWSVEYRRVGETGGGWPGTFHDAAAGVDFVATLATRFPLDLMRVVAMGHSAGGHLAFWAAGRHHIPPNSEFHLPRTQVSLRGALSLAGAVDLRLTIDLSGCGAFAHDKYEVYNLMGGTPEERPERYQTGNPGDLLHLRSRRCSSREVRTIRFQQIFHTAGRRWQIDRALKLRSFSSMASTTSMWLIQAAAHGRWF